MAGQPKGPSVSDTLVRLLCSRYWPHRTSGDEPFVVRFDTPSVLIRLRGNSGLRQRLAADYFRATGKAATSNALADALGVAEGMSYGKKPVTPSLRIARHGDELFLDLGRPDGAAVLISAHGWRVVSRPPVLFARTALTGELPVPQPGSGDLDAVRGIFNITEPARWALFIACRIASLFPAITHPIEALTGPAGSGKTTITRLMGNWVDPAPAMMPVPRDGRTWAAMAASRYVLPIDNVSWIVAWWSDLLCKAASGDGWVDRALYQDLDVVVAAFQSVVILNGIGFGSLRGDLADRMVGHELVRPARYVSDDQMERIWQAGRAQALAWLLDRACEVMADLGHVPAGGSSRLVQFEQIVRCVDARWGTRAMDRWAESRRDILEDVIEGDPVAVAIRAAISSPWTGTSGDLLDLLEIAGLGSQNHGKPWTPRGLSEAVDRARTALEHEGWQLQRYRTGHQGSRVWTVVPPAAQNGQAVPPMVRGDIYKTWNGGASESPYR
jgi:hypothetical protein